MPPRVGRVASRGRDALEHDFWHQRWAEKQIGFHQQRVNSRLRKYWPQLGVAPQAGAFVPLCGKSLDMIWLAEQGHAVRGVELSEIACRDFFADNRLPFSESDGERYRRFCGVGEAAAIELWAGDFFALQAADLAGIGGVYDRAALVALPPQMRGDYVAKLAELLAPGTPLLLIGMQYDQNKMKGPPFSVPDEEVRALFAADFSLELLGCSQGPEIVGNLAERGLDTLVEHVYLITRN